MIVSFHVAGDEQEEEEEAKWRKEGELRKLITLPAA